MNNIPEKVNFIVGRREISINKEQARARLDSALRTYYQFMEDYGRFNTRKSHCTLILPHDYYFYLEAMDAFEPVYQQRLVERINGIPVLFSCILKPVVATAHNKTPLS